MEKEAEKKSKKVKPEDVMKNIMKNYEEIEKSLVNQLTLKVPNHSYTEGTYRETVWKSLLEMIIPKKYCMEQGIFIIDSKKHISAEVDLVIFDELYTPYIFNYGKIKFIPIEAVCIVVECKSSISSLTGLTNWVETIDNLDTSRDASVRIMTGLIDNTRPVKPVTQSATRPVKILCATSVDAGQRNKLMDKFDIILHVEGEHIRKCINWEDKDYSVWYNELNHKETEPKPVELIKAVDIGRKIKELQVLYNQGEENVIMSLTFQLNQLIMLINNPMMFPHRAYAEVFSKIWKQENCREE